MERGGLGGVRRLLAALAGQGPRGEKRAQRPREITSPVIEELIFFCYFFFPPEETFFPQLTPNVSARRAEKWVVPQCRANYDLKSLNDDLPTDSLEEKVHRIYLESLYRSYLAR